MASTFPTDDQLAAYRATIESILERIHQAKATLDLGTGERIVESAALDLRKALEGLLLSSLVTHLDRLSAIEDALARQKPSDARKMVERLSMAKLRSPLVANLKSPPLVEFQLVLSRVPPFARACLIR